MQKDFYIFLELPDGSSSVVGRLLYERLADGTIRSFFRYEPQWLARPLAFPLDPVNLPLAKSVFSLKSRTGLWGVMEDALPDAWGRRIIQARHSLDVSRSNNITLLLLAGWAEPGATGFAQGPEIPPRLVTPMDMDMMDQALMASEAFERNAQVVNLPDFFVSGGSSAGGARPKVLARAANTDYLIKFPSINDPSPDMVAQLEFFGLRCAACAGVPVSDFFLIKGKGERLALAVKRFDTTDSGGRLHFLSFQSLTGVEEQLGLPYYSMADIIRRVSGSPERDLQDLFKQMVVNALIFNCDDHLKNFSMLFSAGLGEFCLSPAYDIVPNLYQREHILSIGGSTSNITIDNLVDEGRRFSLSVKRSLKLANEAVRGVLCALKENRELIEGLCGKHALCRNLFDDINANVDQLGGAIVRV